MGFCKRLLYAMGADEQYVRSLNIKESELDFVYLPAAMDCRILAMMRNALVLARPAKNQSLGIEENMPLSFSVYHKYCDTLELTRRGVDEDNHITEVCVVYSNLVKCILSIITKDLQTSLCYDNDAIVTLLCENIQHEISVLQGIDSTRRAANGIPFPGGIYWPQWQRFRRENHKWAKFIYFDEKQLFRFLNMGLDTPISLDFDYDQLSGVADLKPPSPIEVDKLIFPAMCPDISTQLTSFQSTINANTIFDSFESGCVLVDGDNVSVPLLYVMLRSFHQKRSIKKVLIICDTPPIFRWDLSFPGFVTYEAAEHTRTKKNAGDILLAYRLAQLEASGKFDKFILVSSDSDYASLCKLLADKLLLLIDESRASVAYFNLLSRANVDFILMKDLIEENNVAKLLGLGGNPDYTFITHILMNGGALWKS